MHQANFDFADPLENIHMPRQAATYKSEYVRRRSNLVTQQTAASAVKLIRSGESLNVQNNLAES